MGVAVVIGNRQGKECQVRQCIDQLIEEARVAVGKPGTDHASFERPTDGCSKLGAEAVRLARIAAAIHMTMAAQLLSDDAAPATLASAETSA